MKIHTTLVFSGLLLTNLLGQNEKANAQVAYAKGQAAEKAGDVAAARSFYSSALQADPAHAHARYSLGQLKITSGAIAAKGREAKFGAVLVPAFQVDGVTLQEALQALSIIIEKQSKEEVSPNFVVEDPKNQFAESRISLNLKNLPAKGVLNYLTQQVGAKARFDEHAVVISPR